MSDNQRKEEENTQNHSNKKEKLEKCDAWEVILHEVTPIYEAVEVLGVYACREDAVKVLHRAAVEYDGENVSTTQILGGLWRSKKQDPGSQCWIQVRATSFYAKGYELWHVEEGSKDRFSDERTFYSRSEACIYVIELKRKYAIHHRHFGDWAFEIPDNSDSHDKGKWSRGDSYIKMYKRKVQ